MCTLCETIRTREEYTERNNKFFSNNSTARSKSLTPFLYSFKDTLMCRFCGGKNCKHENFRNHPNPAIYGLNSDQIDENIFASQRPSNVLITKFNLIQRFKEKKIGLIVNVQRPGEHPYCGPNANNLDISGYSYAPSKFTSNNIEVKLTGWKDMNVPDSLSFMLDIVKSMHKVIQNKKKVLVHCHAGYGRTGICIASYKMFREKINAQLAVAEIRKIRKQCVQSKSQMEYCKTFYKYLEGLWSLFGQKKSITFYLNNQRDLNVGEFKNYNEFVPLMITYPLSRIIELKEMEVVNSSVIYRALSRKFDIRPDINEYLNPIIDNLNTYSWDIFERYDDVVIISELMFKWMKESVLFCIDLSHLNALVRDPEFTKKKVESIEKHMSKYEIEIMKLFSQFYKQLISDDTKNKDEIEDMKHKIAEFLLGSEGKDPVENLVQLIDDFEKSEVDILIDENEGDQYTFFIRNQKTIQEIIRMVKTKAKESRTESEEKKSDEENLNSLLQSINVNKSIFKSNDSGINRQLTQFQVSRLNSVYVPQGTTETDLNRKNGNDNVALSRPWLKEEDC